MNKELLNGLVKDALDAIEKSPAPNRALPYFNADKGYEVTGYEWTWTLPEGSAIIVSVRIRPGPPQIRQQHVRRIEKKSGKIVLHVIGDEVSIRRQGGGSDYIHSSKRYVLSFPVNSTPNHLNPIEGLEDLLRDSITVPLDI